MESFIQKIKVLFSKRPRRSRSERPRVFRDWKMLVSAVSVLAVCAAAFSIMLSLHIEEGASVIYQADAVKKLPIDRTYVERAVSIEREKKTAFKHFLANPPVFVDPSL